MHSAYVTVWGAVSSETRTVPHTRTQETKDSFHSGLLRMQRPDNGLRVNSRVIMPSS